MKPRADLPVGCRPYQESSEVAQEQIEETRSTLARLRDLVNSAEDGDTDALSEIRQLLGKRPDLAWRLFDLAKVAEQGLMKRGFGEDQPSVKATLRRQLECMRSEIAGENSSPLERLLAERIVATWLELQTFETLYFQNEGKLTMSQGEYHQKRLDRAHRRHLSAIRTLAQIRKLSPAVQINIAEKEINTAG